MADKEFAFDLTLHAVARVRAVSEKAARAKLDKFSSSIHIGLNEGGIELEDAGQMQDVDPLLFEIDRQDPPFPSEAHYIAAAKDDGWLPGDSDSAKEYCESNHIDASESDPKDARL